MNSFIRFVKENGGDVTNIIYSQNLLKGQFCSCNTSCVWYNDGLLINSRLVNYRKIYQLNSEFKINDMAQTYIYNKQGFDSRNVMSIVKNSNICDTKEIYYPESIVPDVRYKGLEDARLVVWDGKLYAYGTRWDRVDGYGCICIYELNENFVPVNEFIVHPQNQGNCEKNWAAVEDRPFTFVYAHNPTQVITINKNGYCELIVNNEKNEKIQEWVKGSTPLIKYNDDEYITMVHTNKVYQKNGLNYTDYLTAFVFYDKNFNMTRMSKWFVFNSAMCEFVCGLAKKDDIIYITYSQLDCTSHLVTVNKDVIEKFMEQPDNSIGEYTFYDYYNLAKYYEDNGQKIASFVLYNFASQIADISPVSVSDELKLECLIKHYCGVIEYLPDILIAKIYYLLADAMEKIAIQYPISEMYYLLSAIYKMCGDKYDEYLKYKQLGDNNKSNIHNYFFKYFNPNYL